MSLRASACALFISTAVVGLVAAVPADAAVPAFAGGGCGSNGSGGGGTFKACVSGAGSSVNFDGYVTSSSSSCSAHLVLFQNGSGIDQGPSVSCHGSGVHIPGGSWPVTHGASYFSEIFVTINGSSYARSSLTGTG